jgi:hypothetical protein
MKGTVLEFSLQQSQGVISGDDGGRYAFASSEWKSAGAPKPGAKVDFAPGPSGTATGVYAAAGAGMSVGGMSSSMTKAVIAIVCAVLAFFLPGLGVILAIFGLVLGIKARKEAQAEGDENAALVGLIAIVITAIALIFAALALLSLLALGGGLGLMRML